jgi:SAM-dependent methyltransferase
MPTGTKGFSTTAGAYERRYRGPTRPRWDKEGPTAFVRALHERGAITGPVLDAGCGTGENVLYLAGRGHEVIAVDAAPTAIKRARERAQARGLSVDFRLLDARQLGDLPERFNTVIDSGVFHVLGREGDRIKYASALARVCNASAHVYLLAFRGGPLSDSWIAGAARSLIRATTGIGTHGVSRRELTTAFGSGWLVESFEPPTDGRLKFIRADIRRLGNPGLVV